MPRPKEVGKGGGGNSGEERAEEAGAFAWPFVEGMPLHGGSLVCVCVCVCVCEKESEREKYPAHQSLAASGGLSQWQARKERSFLMNTYWSTLRGM
jgi:hypothetical protein